MIPDEQQQRIQAAYDNMGRAMSEFMREIAVALQPVFDYILAFGQAAHNAFYKMYLEDGAPYGETHEGMMRWLQERQAKYLPNEEEARP
jgi:hypothetical protein